MNAIARHSYRHIAKTRYRIEPKNAEMSIFSYTSSNRWCCGTRLVLAEVLNVGIQSSVIQSH